MIIVTVYQWLLLFYWRGKLRSSYHLLILLDHALRGGPQEEIHIHYSCRYDVMTCIITSLQYQCYVTYIQMHAHAHRHTHTSLTPNHPIGEEAITIDDIHSITITHINTMSHSWLTQVHVEWVGTICMWV